jgi:hypothetical protein
MTKYTFWPNSIEGLTQEIHIEAMDYIHAKQKVQKIIAQQKEHLYLIAFTYTLEGGEFLM